MKPPLKLKKTAIHTRIFFGFFAAFIISFAALFILLPVTHIVQHLSTGVVPWPLIGFAFLSIPFGGLMMWLAARYRVWIFPYQFTVDYSQKVCGYQWRESWMDRVSLSDLRALVSAPAWSERVWPWVIYAEFSDGRERKAIFNSHKQFGREVEAFSDCMETCEILSNYLEVPIEFDEWTEEVISQETSRRKRGCPPTSPSVSMISRNYNPNPAFDVDPR